jgi:1-acyl-sn-glycerol-3-phosphate acyltransferase
MAEGGRDPSLLPRGSPMGTTGLSSRLDWVFRTTLSLLLLPAATIALSTCALFRVLRGAPRSKIDSVYWTFGRFVLRVGGTRLEVHGLENIRPGQGYVVVPNHESNWDPPALLATLTGTPVRFVVKKEITGIPIFGWAIVQSGSVRVERTGGQSDVDRIRERMGTRPHDISMLFYAEGTRSRDGALHPFKKGAFATAIAHRLPVLPIGHAGCYRIWDPRVFGIRSGPVVVHVGRPIPAEHLGYDDREKLRDQTFDAVRELRTRARRRIRELGVDPGGID